jgi:hypothetical protein
VHHADFFTGVEARNLERKGFYLVNLVYAWSPPKRNAIESEEINAVRPPRFRQNQGKEERIHPGGVRQFRLTVLSYTLVGFAVQGVAGWTLSFNTDIGSD